ncbi:hypothetical protein ACFFX0_03100 [Citricoccus parietis]|uniref:Uncharacterized protein n=1 Tax=Citricoccus parietis TaxID=592307 RepID=A0ABV5FU90_9MICC
MFEPAVWCTYIAWRSVDGVPQSLTLLSSAPHCARVMIFGLTASAEALAVAVAWAVPVISPCCSWTAGLKAASPPVPREAAGTASAPWLEAADSWLARPACCSISARSSEAEEAASSLPSVSAVPGSMSSSSRPAGTSPSAVVTRAWMASPPLEINGSVPTRSAWGASSPSWISMLFQSVHSPASRTRRDTSVTWSASAMSHVTPATMKSMVSTGWVRAAMCSTSTSCVDEMAPLKTESVSSSASGAAGASTAASALARRSRITTSEGWDSLPADVGAVPDTGVDRAESVEDISETSGSVASDSAAAASLASGVEDADGSARSGASVTEGASVLSGAWVPSVVSVPSGVSVLSGLGVSGASATSGAGVDSGVSATSGSASGSMPPRAMDCSPAPLISEATSPDSTAGSTAFSLVAVVTAGAAVVSGTTGMAVAGRTVVAVSVRARAVAAPAFRTGWSVRDISVFPSSGAERWTWTWDSPQRHR